MPYDINEALPESIQKHLPKHAQDIYREAFNHAYKEYQDPDKKRDKDDSVEKISHRVAWSAVKKV
ncbi:MAG: ChaB family protein [Candidatus Cardinium sp.]|uniref:ChaB family protein n=1 Tax=Cardinium endosymbiont of Dermatophagoides farinae TaxID=2597823 RepID=UPI001CB8E2E6|nr:ChaB family protein [Cardinium endosymbiont of Dermatophagoides farinae]UWW96762.1 MAG: ChaB family protein [Candidatus Cardinium sp.]